MFEVNHKIYGNGNAIINENRVFVDFNGVSRTFVYPDAFEKFLTTEDGFVKTQIAKVLEDKKNKKLEEEKKLEEKLNELTKKIEVKKTTKSVLKKEVDLIGKRAGKVSFKNKNDLYEVIGYLCTPGRIVSIDAEVPDNDKAVEFEMNFPGQKYMPIKVDYTPSGVPNKMSASFRIIFRNTDNCPRLIAKDLREDNGKYRRLNKSYFIYDLVTEYGFRFGNSQDVDKIKKIAINNGYEEDFNRGFNL